MPTYHYIAVSPQGERTEGFLRATSEQEVHRQLASQGQRAQQVRQQDEKLPKPSILERLFVRASAGALSRYFFQLYQMYHAGMTLREALDLLGRSGDVRGLRRISLEMRDEITRAEKLSAALSRRPALFPPICYGIVRAGEQGGTLEGSFQVLAEHYEQMARFESELRRRTFIAKLEGAALLAILVAGRAILAWVMGGSASGAAWSVLSSVVWIGSALVGLIFLWRILRHERWFRRIVDSLSLLIPGLSRPTRQLCMMRWTRAVAALLKAGVPIGATMEYSSEAIGNEVLRERVLRAVPLVRDGMPVSEALAVTMRPPPMVDAMLRTGEQAGKTDEMLSKVAEYYEDMARTTLHTTAVVTGLGALLLYLAVGSYVVITAWMSYGRFIESLIEK